jgi:hypothetical protein
VRAPGERLEPDSGAGLVGRLAEQAAVERDVGVNAEDESTLPRAG